MEPGGPAAVPAAGRSWEWYAVSEKFICPDCGNLVEVPDQSGDAARAVIESMGREIRMLRETVALLRGTRAG
jgi:transcription initiation factor IIE alpha subunit